MIMYTWKYFVSIMVLSTYVYTIVYDSFFNVCECMFECTHIKYDYE